MPCFDIFNQYSIELKAFTLLQSEMKDPVVYQVCIGKGAFNNYVDKMR